MGTKENNSIYNKIGYLKTMILTGFLKSVIGTGFISIGTTILFMGLSAPVFNPNTVYVGITGMALGALIYFAGDIYKVEQKKKEINIIEKKIDTVEKKTEKQIEEEVERMVEHIVEDAEEEKQKIIASKMKQMEIGICGDIANVCRDEGNLKYCGEKLRNAANLISYPDSFPAKSIINVSILKIEGKGLNAGPKEIKAHIECLFENDLISRKKYEECLELIKSGDV